MNKPVSLQIRLGEVRSDAKYGTKSSPYKSTKDCLLEVEKICEYAFFEIVRDIPDKASLEVVKSAFENMLSKEKIEEIVNFVESLRK